MQKGPPQHALRCSEEAAAGEGKAFRLMGCGSTTPDFRSRSLPPASGSVPPQACRWSRGSIPAYLLPPPRLSRPRYGSTQPALRSSEAKIWSNPWTAKNIYLHLADVQVITTNTCRLAAKAVKAFRQDFGLVPGLNIPPVWRKLGISRGSGIWSQAQTMPWNPIVLKDPDAVMALHQPDPAAPQLPPPTGPSSGRRPGKGCRESPSPSTEDSKH